VRNLISHVKGRTHRLRVCENRVLRRILGSRRDEVTGGWRKLRHEELHNLYWEFRFSWRSKDDSLLGYGTM
jgi:hypothetical protein